MLVGEQQMMIFEPEHVDLPRRDILTSGPDPMIIFNLCLMHNFVSAGVYKLYKIDFIDSTRDFNKGAIDKIETTTIRHIHGRLPLYYPR